MTTGCMSLTIKFRHVLDTHQRHRGSLQARLCQNSVGRNKAGYRRQILLELQLKTTADLGSSCFNLEGDRLRIVIGDSQGAFDYLVKGPCVML
jgi:hypothetical protein